MSLFDSVLDPLHAGETWNGVIYGTGGSIDFRTKGKLGLGVFMVLNGKRYERLWVTMSWAGRKRYVYREGHSLGDGDTTEEMVYATAHQLELTSYMVCGLSRPLMEGVSFLFFSFSSIKLGLPRGKTTGTLAYI